MAEFVPVLFVDPAVCVCVCVWPFCSETPRFAAVKDVAASERLTDPSQGRPIPERYRRRRGTHGVDGVGVWGEGGLVWNLRFDGMLSSGLSRRPCRLTSQSSRGDPPRRLIRSIDGRWRRRRVRCSMIGSWTPSSGVDNEGGAVAVVNSSPI